jgi:hypothetical protein
LHINLRGFSSSCCPQHSLRRLFLPDPMCLLNYVLNCKENFSFFIIQSGLSDIQINCNRIKGRLVLAASVV